MSQQCSDVGYKGQVEQEKYSFLQYKPQFPYLWIAVYCSNVKNNKGILSHTERECVKETDDFISCDILGGDKALIPVLSIYHSEDVEPCGSLGWDADLLSRQLPAIENISLGTDVALIGIVEVYIPSAFLSFQVLTTSGSCTRRTAARGYALSVSLYTYILRHCG